MLPICVQTIFVSDLDRAIRFYRDGLGYEVKARYGPCIAQLKTESTTLILEQIEGRILRRPQPFFHFKPPTYEQPCAVLLTPGASWSTQSLKGVRSVLC